ncbi:MAG: DUF3999 family protein [Rhodanobacteraceae bacterium]|nr:DUF3999 family protein [Rhodanobacteraceae bacterium]
MCAQTCASAEPPPPHDPRLDEFATVFPLSVEGDDGVLQVQLPLPVYQASRAPGLADVRVYNGAGQLLPYALHYPEQRTRIEVREQTTTQFPLYETAVTPGAAGGIDLQLRTGPDGALVSLDARTSAPQPAPSRKLAALVVDLGPSARNEVLQSLRFQLAESVGDYHARLAIERSDDLKLWDGVAHGTLDWISASDQTIQLVSDRIELPRGDGRYLKVRWVDGEPLAFAAIVGEWRGATATLDPQLELTLQAQPGRVGGDWVFHTSPSIAATAIGLDLPEANTVMPVTIGFYRRQRVPKPEWLLAPQLGSTFYRLNHNGRERVSSRIHVSPQGNAEWVVRPHTAGHAPPQLVLGWRPQTLVFTARGEDFKLAIGADPEAVRHWRGGPAALAQVAPGFSPGEIAQLDRAVVGLPQPPPAKAEAVAPAPPEADAEAAARQRRFALWSVLGLGIVLLCWMTWRLYEQMVEGRSGNSGG